MTDELFYVTLCKRCHAVGVAGAWPSDDGEDYEPTRGEMVFSLRFCVECGRRGREVRGPMAFEDLPPAARECLPDDWRELHEG